MDGDYAELNLWLRPNGTGSLKRELAIDRLRQLGSQAGFDEPDANGHVQENGDPESHLKRWLRGLVMELLLSNKRPWPAAKNIHQVQIVLGRAAVPVLRGGLVPPIHQIRQSTETEIRTEQHGRQQAKRRGNANQPKHTEPQHRSRKTRWRLGDRNPFTNMANLMRIVRPRSSTKGRYEMRSPATGRRELRLNWLM